MQQINPSMIASRYLEGLKRSVAALGKTIHVVGFIASDDQPSIAYANATRKTFEAAGFIYDLRRVPRLDLEEEIVRANSDSKVHGIFIYFPVFKNQEDDYLRNLVDHTKDIEAGSLYWTRKMSANDRLASGNDENKKALLPCTPLAILKILDELGEYDVDGKVVTIYNRSEVIGRPLAVMMSNDGARVFSFDENGPLEFRAGLPEETSITREAALAESDIIITGVPIKSFECIRASEVKTTSICINFSSIPNFDKDIAESVRIFVPRVGPMTVAMCMRNTIRLFEHFHQ